MFRFKAGNLMDRRSLNELMDGEKADLVYTDPPWSKAFITRFYNMAEIPEKPVLADLFSAIVANLRFFGKDQFCVEMGAIGKELLHETLESSDLYLYTIYNTRYGKDKPCYIFHGGITPRSPDDPDRFLALEGQKIVEAAIETFTCIDDTVLDFCIGQGMIARACHATGRSCYGLELSQERLDKTIEYCMAKDIPFEEIL